MHPSNSFVSNKLKYCLHSGKNRKFPYFLKSGLSLIVPPAFFRSRRGALFSACEIRPDQKEILARVGYYNRLSPDHPVELPAMASRIGEQRIGKKSHVYFFDTRRYLRYFPPDCRWLHIPGDVTTIPPAPAIVKSRPIAGPNENSVLLNLNKVRHFIFVKDNLPFADKRPIACLRGKINGKAKRIALFEKHFGNPLLDLGDTSSTPVDGTWQVPPMSIWDQLSYRFILAIEGTDVASNLKWIMSSNSIAVMPRPEFETWFQEGLLVPGVHYIEVAPDYSDLTEKIRYYQGRPEACAKIIDAAHRWVDRFQDPVREDLISLLVLRRYFEATGQKAILA